MPELARLCTYEKIAACAGGAGVWGCFGLNPGGVEVLLPRPFGERAGVRGLDVGDAAGRDVRPAAQSLSFVSPKESNQRKGDPTGCVPPLRCGQPAMLAVRVRCGTRCALTRFAQTTAASQITKRVHPSVHPLTPPAALLGASRGEEGNHTGHCCARPWVFSLCGSGLARDGAYVLPMRSSRASPLPHPVTQAERSDGPKGLVESPSGRAEKRRAWGGRGSAACRALCSDSLRLFERRERSEQSEFRSAAPCPSIAGCPEAKRRGHGQWGRLFFGYFLLARQKKVTAPPGAHPGQQRPQTTTVNKEPDKPLTPTPGSSPGQALSPAGRGGKTPGKAK